MPEVVLFTPAAKATGKQNLAAFVAFCRDQLTTFGADLPFEENVWEITDHVDVRGHGDKLERIRFSHGSVRGKPEHWLKEPFLSFAKAYLRYAQALAPVQLAHRRITAMRVLERALAESCNPPCITSLNQATLNRAAAIARAELGQAVAYQVGCAIAAAAALISDLRLVQLPLSMWKNPNPKKPDVRNRIGSEFDAKRAASLPSDDEMAALAIAYRTAVAPLDIAMTSIAALMCCAPDRINEVLALPVNCEVERERPDGTLELGLRWPGSKGASDHIKWVLPTFEALAREALSRLKKVTDEARSIASWYQRHPDQIYLPPGLEYLRQRETLTASEFAAVAAVSEKHKGDWYGPRGIRPLSSNPWRISFSEVEQEILKSLPRNFPIADKRTQLQFQEALCVAPGNFTRPEWPTSGCSIQAITINQVNQQLGSGSRNGKSSVFSRNGITLPNGTPVALTTKKFRHFLNTVAQGSGLSQFEIAKWSGRVNVSQNIAYDHVSATELLSQCNEVLDLQNPSGELTGVTPRPPISIREFKKLGFATAHVTEVGFCVHDFVMLPCQLQMDCDNCDEHVCVKGDEARTARVKDRLSNSEALLRKAECAVAENRRGADRWFNHHKSTVDRLTKLVAILDDPDVPVGAVIRLNRATGASLIEAATARALGPLEAPSASVLPSSALLSEVKRLGVLGVSR